MKRIPGLALGIAMLSSAALAVAGPAGKQTGSSDGESTPVAVQPYRAGVVSIDDPRILDLTGSYVLTGSDRVTLTLDIVQDARGKLAGSFTLDGIDGVTSETWPLAGNLAVQRSEPLKFTLAGSIRKPGKPGNGNGNDRGNNGNRGKSGLSVRGVFDGTAFDVTVRLQGKGKPVEFEGVLVPANPLRGAVISDAPATSGTKVTSSLRTAALPWGTVELRTQERAAGPHTMFYASSGISGKGRKGMRALGKAGIFEADIKGRATGTGNFAVSHSNIRLGYGHLDSTAATSVTRSLYD